MLLTCGLAHNILIIQADASKIFIFLTAFPEERGQTIA